jgi:hypothetical protein
MGWLKQKTDRHVTLLLMFGSTVVARTDHEYVVGFLMDNEVRKGFHANFLLTAQYGRKTHHSLSYPSLINQNVMFKMFQWLSVKTNQIQMQSSSHCRPNSCSEN